MRTQWQVWECHDRLHLKPKYVTKRGMGREERVLVFGFFLQIRAAAVERAGRSSLLGISTVYKVNWTTPTVHVSVWCVCVRNGV